MHRNSASHPNTLVLALSSSTVADSRTFPRFKTAAESTNSRVKYWSIFQGLALIGVCAWQVYHLKVRSSPTPPQVFFNERHTELTSAALGQAFFETKRTI